MCKRYYMYQIVALFALVSCSAAVPEKSRISSQSDITRCIGSGAFNAKVLDRCGLSMWAIIPVFVSEDKQLAMQIPKDSDRITLPCTPKRPWVGHLSEMLIAKCYGDEARLYWIKPKPIKGGFSFRAVLYDGDDGVEYTIQNDYDVYWPGIASAQLEFDFILESDRKRVMASKKKQDAAERAMRSR